MSHARNNECPDHASIEDLRAGHRRLKRLVILLLASNLVLLACGAIQRPANLEVGQLTITGEGGKSRIVLNVSDNRAANLSF